MKRFISLPYLPLVIVFALSFFAVKAFFSPHLFLVHDNVQAERVYEMARGIRDLQIPVRWVTDLGYGFGYPLFNFYAPLPYYFGAIFYLIGFPLILSTKIMELMGVLGAAAGMYFLAKEIWGRFGGIVAALFYMYAPYHAVQIYVRGSVGEYWAYALMPFIFWSLYRLLKEGRRLHFAVFVLSFAALLISHNIFALLVTPLVILFAIMYMFLFRKVSVLTIVGIELAIMLSLFFMAPALVEKDLTQVDSVIRGMGDYTKHFVAPFQFWSSPWGYGGSAEGTLDGLSFRVGKLHFAFVALAFVLSIWFFASGRVKRGVFAFGLTLSFVISLFLQTEYSLWLWSRLPLLSYVQFPWRLLVFSAFFASLLAGFVGSFFYRIHRLIGFLLLFVSLFLLIFSSKVLVGIFESPLFKPQQYLTHDESYYTNRDHLLWEASKVSDEYLPANFIKPLRFEDTAQELVDVLSNDTSVTMVSNTSSKLSMRATVSGEDGFIVVKKAYFPGWKASVNGKELPFLTVNGKMGFVLSHGTYDIVLTLHNTPVRNGANFLSVLGFITFLGILSKRKLFA